MDNNDTDTRQPQQPQQPQTPAAMLAACYAGTCRFNRGGMCNILALEIGKSGRCLNFEERTADKLRQYLAERGLPDAAIEQIIAEDAKNGGTD